ncbi:hypothetical protein ACJ41O_000041 [Fusarium nematophilum]
MEAAELRRERKRQTDRNAQRQHRKRQKQYIEELEAQIALLKSTGQTKTSQLAAQNLTLQDELKQMHSLWDEMEDLMQRQRDIRRQSILNVPIVVPEACRTPSDDDNRDNDASPRQFTVDSSASKNDPPVTCPEPGLTGEPSDAIGLSELDELVMQGTDPVTHFPTVVQDADLELDGNFEMFTTQDNTIDAIFHGEPSLFDACDAGLLAATERPSTARQEPQDQEVRGAPCASNQGQRTPTRATRLLRNASKSPRRFRRSRVQNSHKPDTAVHQGQLTEYSTGNEPSWYDPGSHHQRDPLDGFMELFGAYMEHCIPALSPTIWSIDGAPEARHNMPMLLFPPLPKDKPLHGIIERASKNPDSIGPPTLVDFLFDNPRNSLSVDLKTYLAPMRRTRRTSEFLATYWVLYLLLRWQIVQSDEAYQSLPPWLRPTPLQLSVLHPVMADLIAWPEIREGLIHMSLSDSQTLHDISYDVGRYLTVDIQAAEHDLLNDPQQISAQILNLSNWKLDREFFDRYPQWKSLAPRLVSPRPTAVV